MYWIYSLVLIGLFFTSTWGIQWLPHNCEMVSPPDNGYILNPKAGTSPGAQLVFACNQGYKPLGNCSMRCILGTWQPPNPPKCIPKVHTLPKIANGVVKYDSLNNSNLAVVECNEGYVLNGSKTLKPEDGTWDTPPRCVYCGCGSHPNGTLDLEQKTMTCKCGCDVELGHKLIFMDHDSLNGENCNSGNKTEAYIYKCVDGRIILFNCNTSTHLLNSSKSVSAESGLKPMQKVLVITVVVIVVVGIVIVVILVQKRRRNYRYQNQETEIPMTST